jgi:hypothetical protein
VTASALPPKTDIALGVPVGGDETTIECKGIMVIGAHRKTPLNERKEQAFPDPVARTINRSEICALSGLQLLGLLLAVREDQTQAKRFLELLFSTDGILTEASDWTRFVTKQSS